MNNFKCVPSHHDKLEMEKANMLAKKISENKLSSEYVKKKAIAFISEVNAKAKIREWVESHIDLNISDKENQYIIPIKMPHFDQDKRKYIVIDAKVNVVYCDGGGTLNGRKITDWHHWVYCNVEFNGRLDWQSELFIDILNNQDRLEEWCEEFKLIG